MTMAFRTLSAKAAAELDKELMSSGAFSIDQLMELAGLSVSQAVYRLHPPNKAPKVLIACGPGNNGGDGLVAARHLYHYKYQPSVFYPKQPKNELYQRLTVQLKELGIPFVTDFHAALKETHQVVDATFGFSFAGAVREPFPAVIQAMKDTSLPVLSVDIPSSWDVEKGPPEDGPGMGFYPDALISLTAPKPLSRYFHGRHFIGGRFISPRIAEKYEIDVPEYTGLDQVVEVDSKTGEKL